MDQKNILPRGIAKPIEQQPDGTWIVRHHFRVVSTSENGEELVTFASSEYPEKPTLQQIQRSIDRYRVCLTMYGDTISDKKIEKVDLFRVYVYGLIVQSVGRFRVLFKHPFLFMEKVKIIMSCFIDIYHRN